jgi:hypothetical protein
LGLLVGRRSLSLSLGGKAYAMMRRCITASILILGVAALAVIGFKLANRHKLEPTFSGRTVTQWLTSRDFETNRAAVDTAVLALGGSCVPELRRMLHSGMKWNRVWFAKAPSWLYRRLPFGVHQFDRKDRAMWALKILGRVGRPATADLLAIAQDTTEHWNQRYGAITTLRCIEAKPSYVIPVMDKLGADPVVGTLATSEARILRAAAEAERYRVIEKSLAASVSSTSILNQSFLWGPDKPKLTLDSKEDSSRQQRGGRSEGRESIDGQRLDFPDNR